MRREVLFTAPNVVEVRQMEEIHPGPGEVKVETVLCGISHGTELGLLCGTAAGFHRRWDSQRRMFRDAEPGKRFPVEPGYECVGRVAAVGPGVSGVAEGGLVWIDRPHKECHIVPQAEARAGELPPGVTAERGIFCALSRVALGGVHDAEIKIGDRIAVVGLGAIGLITVQLALASGAAEVFAIDRVPLRRNLARQFGATPIDPDDERLHGRIRETSRNAGVDAAIDTSGSYSGLQLAMACCAVGGIVVAVSTFQGGGAELRLGDEFHRNRLSLRASMTVNGAPHKSHPRWDLDRLNEMARELLASGQLEVERMITQVFPFENAPEAYRLIQCSPDTSVRVALRGPGRRRDGR